MLQKKNAVDEDWKAERAKRIAVGATVAGVLLVIFLVVILVVQFVKIGVRNSEKRKLESEIDRYEQLIENEEKNIDFYMSEQGLRMLAVQHGWVSK